MKQMISVAALHSKWQKAARMLKSFSADGLVELKRGAITLRDKNS